MAEEPNEPEAPAEADDVAADEAPADEAPADEAPAEAAPVEPEEVKEEAPVEEPKEEEASVEEAKEDAKPKKKGRKKGKKKRRKKTLGNAAESAWQKISAKNQESINWYLMKLDGKVGATSDLALVQEGNGGAAELVEFLKTQKKGILFGLLMCVTNDDSGSKRSKFIYIRFVGSGVKMMSKAKLTPTLGAIDDQFPCKHLTLDVADEDCAETLNPRKMAQELLRVGGGHKPSTMSFGPNQEGLLQE